MPEFSSVPHGGHLVPRRRELPEVPRRVAPHRGAQDAAVHRDGVSVQGPDLRR